MKKIVIKILTIILCFNLFVLTTEGQASEDINVISKSKVSVQAMENWAKKKGATKTFISLAKKYVNLSSSHGGVNPVLAYVQAALETGYGHFGGVIDESYFNPCGMKTATGGSDYDKEAHQRFASWEEGIGAHLDHLALYAGQSGYPRKNTKDPRHFPYLKGRGTTVKKLAQTWASDINYGIKIINLMNEIENKKPSSSGGAGNAGNTSGTGNSNNSNGNSNSSSGNSSGSGGASSSSGKGNKNNHLNKTEKEIKKVEGDTVNCIEEIFYDKESLNIIIKGYAVSKHDIKDVQIYLEDKHLGEAFYGQVRTDIQKLYPLYKKSYESGYVGNFKVEDIKSGEYKIKVIVKDGKNKEVINETKLKIENLTQTTAEKTKKENTSQEEAEKLRAIDDGQTQQEIEEATQENKMLSNKKTEKINFSRLIVGSIFLMGIAWSIKTLIKK